MYADLTALLERWAAAVDAAPLAWGATAGMLLLLLGSGYALRARRRRLAAAAAGPGIASEPDTKSVPGLGAPEPAPEVGASGRGAHEAAPRTAGGAAPPVAYATGSGAAPSAPQSAPPAPPRLSERLRRTSDARWFREQFQFAPARGRSFTMAFT